MPKNKKVRWGFKWPQVGGGLVMLAIGGGITYLGLQADRLVIWAAVLAMFGAFMLISGLIGEEGIW